VLRKNSLSTLSRKKIQKKLVGGPELDVQRRQGKKDGSVVWSTKTYSLREIAVERRGQTGHRYYNHGTGAAMARGRKRWREKRGLGNYCGKNDHRIGRREDI